MESVNLFLALSGPITAVAWGAMNLFVRDRARRTAREEYQSVIKGEMDSFELRLLQTLNGKYVNSDLCLSRLRDNSHRLESNEEGIREVREQMHTMTSELVSQLFGVRTWLESLDKHLRMTQDMRGD